MTPFRLLRAAALLLGLAAVAGCSALSSLSNASQALNTYELTPAGNPGAAPARNGRVLLIAPPTTGSALNTNRILIRPNALQVQYLPDAQWVDAAPTLVQGLLQHSIANSGRLRFVGSDPAGPLPDYVLLTDLQAFQAEIVPGGTPPARVVIRMTLTLVRDADRRIIASRSFSRSVGVATTESVPLIVALDQAMRGLLQDAAAWAVGSMGAGVG